MNVQGQSFFNDHEAISFKSLKKLKTPCAQYDVTVPFTMAIMETIASQPLPPADWKASSKAVLSGGNYLVWSSEYSHLCSHYVQDQNVR